LYLVKLRQYHVAFNTFEKAMDQARMQGEQIEANVCVCVCVCVWGEGDVLVLKFVFNT